MDDSLLVSRAMGGDFDSFGQLYDRYFQRVYDFVWRVLRDNDEAAAATLGVFEKALRDLPTLARPAAFKLSLFTVARAAAVSHAEREGQQAPSPSHEEAFGAFGVPDPCRLDDPRLAAQDPELACLVWEGAASLSPRDYAALDLHLRQRFGSADLADVLGVSKSNAHTVMSRMETAAGEAIATFVVARRGGKNCNQLHAVLAVRGFPPYTDNVRRAVDEHIAACETCANDRGSLPALLEIFAALAPLPAPFVLKGEVWRRLVGSWPAAAAHVLEDLPPIEESPVYAPFSAAAGGGKGAGRGGPPGAIPFSDDSRRHAVWFVAAAAGMLLVAFSAGALAFGVLHPGGSRGAGGGVRANTAPAARGTLIPGVAVQTSTPNPTPTLTPVPTGTPTPLATPTPPLPTNTAVPPTPASTSTPSIRTVAPTGSTPTPTGVVAR